MPPRLPRFHAATQRIEDERKLEKILLEAEAAPPDSNGGVYRRSADGHNRVDVVAADDREGVGGTSPGTDPLGALLAKEARGNCGARQARGRCGR